MIVYRTDFRNFKIGDVISSHGDHLDYLSKTNLKTEHAIRETLLNGNIVRSESCYGWEDREVAQRLFNLETSTEKTLYEVEVKEENIVFRSDVNHYSDATNNQKTKHLFEAAVQRYCQNAPILDCHSGPRIEVLFKEGIIRAIL